MKTLKMRGEKTAKIKNIMFMAISQRYFCLLRKMLWHRVVSVLKVTYSCVGLHIIMRIIMIIIIFCPMAEQEILYYHRKKKMYLLFGFWRWLNGHFVISSRFVVLWDKQQFLRKSFYYTRKTDSSLRIVCIIYIFTSSFRPRFVNIGIGKNNNNLKERNKIRRCVLCTIIMMLKTTSRFS